MKHRSILVLLAAVAWSAVPRPALADAASPQVFVSRGPYLQMGTPTSVRVRWRTNTPTDSRVAVGADPQSLTTYFDDPTDTTEHEILVTGLTPDTRTYYSVGSTTAVLAGGASYFVNTAPLPGTPRPTRVWVVGDAGTSTNEQFDVRDAYLQWTGARHTDLWLMLGDNAYNTGTDTEYQSAVFSAYSEILKNSVLWPTRGNHDAVRAGPGNDYYDFFSLPTAAEAGGLVSSSESYYSFDYANIHFICLDSEGSSRASNGAMMVWLRDDIAATNQNWVIAYFHHPPYTKGSHDSDDPGDSGGRMRDMREVALPILDSTGVDLVLTGHSHSYERTMLLNGHYGTSNTLTSEMKIDAGDGRPNGDGRYDKPTLGTGPFEGAVHIVAGSSGHTESGPLNHPAMITSQLRLGSLVIDVTAQQLEVRFLDEHKVVRDSFAILKGPSVGVGPERLASGVRLAPAPNPFAGELRVDFTLPRAGAMRLAVHDLAGRRVAVLAVGERAAGPAVARWNGRDAAGAEAPPGVYFAVLEFEGMRHAARIVRVR